MKIFEKLEKKFQVDKKKTWIGRNLDIIIMICGLIVIGVLTFGLIQTTSDRDKYTDLFFKEKSKNIDLSLEKEKIDKKNKECEDGNTLIYNASLVLADWKIRTEDIMIKIDGILGRYDKLTKNYCDLSSDNVYPFAYEYRSIMDDYQEIISTYETLLKEQAQ